MPIIFSSYKKTIDAFVLEFLDSHRDTFAQINSYGPDVIDRIKKIIVAGKTIRGSLVLLSYGFTNKKPSEDALKIAAAMELMQTALVIHDDIMDHDDVRRGIPSLHIQYKSEALAMCVGDILFFLAFELLGSVKTDAITLGRLIRLFGREYQYVGIAQMADVAKSAKTKEEIVSMYTYKTARYTFALPLMLGAMLAGPPAGEAGTTKDTLKYLESYGVSCGVLFQIRDDELDSENVLGNDITHAYITSAKESIQRLSVTNSYKKILQDLLVFTIARSQ